MTCLWGERSNNPFIISRKNKTLIGGLEHDFFVFPSIGNVIIPTDFHIFQRGRYTPNQNMMIAHKILR